MKKTGPGYDIDVALDGADATLGPLPAKQRAALKKLATANPGLHRITLNVSTDDGVVCCRYELLSKDKSWLVTVSGKTTAE